MNRPKVRLPKRMPVNHAQYGRGKVTHDNGDTSTVVFPGRVTREIKKSHLRIIPEPGDVLFAGLSGLTVPEAVYARIFNVDFDPPPVKDVEQLLYNLYYGRVSLPHDTVTERAHAELKLGLEHDFVGLQLRGFWSLMKIALRSCKRLKDPQGLKVESCGTQIGIRPSGRAFDKAINELVRWLKEQHYDSRYFGRHIYHRVVDDLRKERTASHRRQKDPSEMNPDTIVMGRPVGSFRYTKPEKFDMWKDTTWEWHRKKRNDKGKARRPYRSKSSRYRKPLETK